MSNVASYAKCIETVIHGQPTCKVLCICLLAMAEFSAGSYP